MRAPLISLLISAAGLAAAGCASSPPQQEAPVASIDRGCPGAATDPLHLTTNKPVAERADPEIESILMQRGDPRLMWVNRGMYQTLHALDVELRREQRIAACERSQSGLQTLEAQAGSAGNGAAAVVGADAGAGRGTAANGGAMAGGGVMASGGAAAGGSVMASGGAASGSQGGAPAGASSSGAADVMSTDAAVAPKANANAAPVSAMSAATSRSTLIRKSSLTSTGGSGNGATMPRIVAGSDNDIVARRLRKAAEQETDPALRKKLWKEYADYRQGIAAK